MAHRQVRTLPNGRVVPIRDLLNYHPARDSMGILLSIQDERTPIRGTFQYPDEDQDHVCKLSGYCSIHKTSHDHAKPPSKKRKR